MMMNFFSNIFASEAYNAKVERAKQEYQPASIRGEKHCLKCGFCCLRRTCIPTFQELKVIAEYLNLTIMQVFKKFLVIDTLNNADYYLRFANNAQKDILGEFLPPHRTYDFAQCVMWNEETKECRIYEVRPEDARGMKCLEIPAEKYVMPSWNKEDFKALGIDTSDYDNTDEEDEEDDDY